MEDGINTTKWNPPEIYHEHNSSVKLQAERKQQNVLAESFKNANRKSERYANSQGMLGRTRGQSRSEALAVPFVPKKIAKVENLGYLLWYIASDTWRLSKVL